MHRFALKEEEEDHQLFRIPNCLFKTPTLISAPVQILIRTVYKANSNVFTGWIKADGIAIAKIVMATDQAYSLFNMQEKMNRFDSSK